MKKLKGIVYCVWQWYWISKKDYYQSEDSVVPTAKLNYYQSKLDYYQSEDSVAPTAK